MERSAGFTPGRRVISPYAGVERPHVPPCRGGLHRPPGPARYDRIRFYDPRVGRWTSADPLGFAAGDPNLYRYAFNDPANAIDPTGLKFWTRVDGADIKEGKDAEDLFFRRLGTSDGQRTVLAALRKNKEFEQIWDYVRKAEWDIELRVAPGLKGRADKEVYGGFARGLFQLNPKKTEALDNPLELADTVVHEAIHAALFIRGEEGEKGYPLSKDVRDIGHDPVLKKGKINSFIGMSKEFIKDNAELKDYCDKNYGDYSPRGKPPRTTYLDINKQGQEVIVRIVGELLKDPKVKAERGVAETWTADNVKLLKERQEKEKK
jgi:hypothetical protein